MAAADAPATGDTPPTATLDKKKSIILGLVGLAVIVLIFVRVIPQIGSYEDALTSLQDMTFGALVAVVLAVVVYLVVYGFPFKAATPGLSYWHSQQLNQAAFAISNGIPAGGAFGLGVQYAMLASYEVTPFASTAAIVSVGVWSIFVTLGLPILGVAAIQLSGAAATSYVVPALIGLLVFIVAVVAFALVIRSERVAAWLGRLGNRLLRPIVHRFRPETTVDLVASVLGFRSSIAGLVSRRWAVISVAQASVSFCQFLILYMALRGVEGWGNAGTSALVAFGAFAVAQIGLLIPITPGGLGTTDAVLIAVLTALGTSEGAATAADLVWRACSFVPQIAVGVIALITWSRRAARTLAERDARRAGEAAADGRD